MTTPGHRVEPATTFEVGVCLAAFADLPLAEALARVRAHQTGSRHRATL